MSEPEELTQADFGTDASDVDWPETVRVLQARVEELEGQLEEAKSKDNVAKPEKPLSLKDFTVGSRVEVFLPKHGIWTPGEVVEIGTLGDQIHVATEYGSHTIASTHRIRKA